VVGGKVGVRELATVLDGLLLPAAFGTSSDRVLAVVPAM